MTIYNFGSVNIDFVLRVPHLPGPGETLHATGHSSGLGGKGANQSVAAARAGATVFHIGAVGEDGRMPREVMERAGVRLDHLAEVDGPTGQALILVDEEAENNIVLLAGANACQSAERIKAALASAKAGDTLMMQNETNCQVEAARMAADKGMRMIYSAAPFDAQAVQAVLPHVSLLLVNRVEAEQLSGALSIALADLPVDAVAVTKGAEGADWHDLKSGQTLSLPSPKVTAVDTTGAGDCFAGYLAAALDAGLPPPAALERALAAAALAVTREGASQSIPTAQEVAEFLSRR
jgi:ribokinase